MGLKSDLLKVGSANFVNLLNSLANSFFLPIILSIGGYADYKTYILYTTFIGFLHLGFVDGINILYGGKTVDQVNQKDFFIYHLFFVIFQLLISLIILVIGIIDKNVILILLTISILPINVQSFFLFFYQATGEFRRYSITILLVPTINILATLIFFVNSISDYKYYITANIAGYFISALFLEYTYLKNVMTKISLNDTLTYTKEFIFNTNLNLLIDKLKPIFLSGFYIMLGTVVFNLFFATGRWIAKIYTSNESFAIYSLSLSLIGIIIIFVSAINKTFYPYLYKNQQEETILNLRNILYILSTLSIPAFFIIDYFVLNFLPQYENALPITSIIITSLPGIFIINSIYVNLYKIKKIERRFLFDSIIYLSIAFSLTLILFRIFKSLQSIALASVLSVYIWTIFPRTIGIIKYQKIMYELIYMLLITGTFFSIIKLEINSTYSFFISLIIISIINILFYRDTIKSIFITQR